MSFTKPPRLCSQRKNTSRFPPTPKCSTACCSTGFTFPPKTAGRTSVGASINSLPSKRRRIPCSAAPTAGRKFYRQEAAEGRSRACTCENCGKEFITTRSDVKYCSDDCRYAAQIKRQGARKKALREAKNEKEAKTA